MRRQSGSTNSRASGYGKGCWAGPDVGLRAAGRRLHGDSPYREAPSARAIPQRWPSIPNNRGERQMPAHSMGTLISFGDLRLGDVDDLGLGLLAVELEDDLAAAHEAGAAGCRSATGVSRSVFLPSTQICGPGGLGARRRTCPSPWWTRACFGGDGAAWAARRAAWAPRRGLRAAPSRARTPPSPRAAVVRELTGERLVARAAGRER